MAKKPEKVILSKQPQSLRNETMSINEMDFPSLSETTGKTKLTESSKASLKQSYSEKLKEKSLDLTKLSGSFTQFSSRNFESHKKTTVCEWLSARNASQNLETKNMLPTKNINPKFNVQNKVESCKQSSELKGYKFTPSSGSETKEVNPLPPQKVKGKNILFSNKKQVNNNYNDLKGTPSHFNVTDSSNVSNNVDVHSSIRTLPDSQNRKFSSNFLTRKTNLTIQAELGLDNDKNESYLTSDEGYTQVIYRKPNMKPVAKNEPSLNDNKYSISDDRKNRMYHSEHGINSCQPKPENIKKMFKNTHAASDKDSKVPFEKSMNEKSGSSSINRLVNLDMHKTKLRSKNSPKFTSTSINLPSQNGSMNSSQRGLNSEQLNVGLNEAKKKRKRKSKAKRQAALQTGKISIMTLETHLKIFNQSNNTKMQAATMLTNINDEKEYPELGMSFNMKEVKKNHVTNESSPVISKNCGAEINEPNPEATALELNPHDKVIEGASEKVSVHSKDPMKLTLFDMLITAKPKKKEAVEKAHVKEGSSVVYPSHMKIIRKKGLAKPVNPLDSSQLSVKRGKESEIPKMKKPSKLRKIILAGRKLKAERVAAPDFTNLVEKSDLIFGKPPAESLLTLQLPKYDEPKSLSEKNTALMKKHCSECTPEVKRCKSASFINQLPINKGSTLSVRFSTKLSSTPKQNWIRSKSLPCLLTWKDFCNNIECQSLRNSENLKETLHFPISHFKENGMTLNKQLTMADNKENNTSPNTEGSLEQKYNLPFECIFKDSVSEARILLNLEKDNSEFTNLNTKVTKYCDILSKCILEESIPEIRNIFIKQNNNRNLTNLSTPQPKSLALSSESKDNYKSVDSIGKDREDKGSLFENNLNKFKPKNPESSSRQLQDDGINPKNSRERTLTENVCALSNTIEIKENFNVQPLEIITTNDDFSNNDHLSSSSGRAKDEPLKRTYTMTERLEVAKVLLHSNKYRDYCNHFVSKELDGAVDLLLDDLARFQDRMHEKEPIKAKMKRRLVYGLKEIKKHLKIKKLKCIIIATDIENIKTEGGLNELLKETISLAEAYHIPYFFSHKRFKLGKICRKPSPVSCVGIFNYEGSEKNFKNILQLHERSKDDYEEITNKLAESLTNDQIEMVNKTVQEVPYTPYEIYRSMVKDIFAPYINESKQPKSSTANTETVYNSEKFQGKTTKNLTTSTSCEQKASGETEDRFKTIQDTLEKYNIVVK